MRASLLTLRASRLRRGVDPIDARDAQDAKAKEYEQAKRAAKARERLTLARAARDYHERVIEPSRTAKHGAQWIASLEQHVPAALWNAPIDGITAPLLLDPLLKLQRKSPKPRCACASGSTLCSRTQPSTDTAAQTPRGR